jgi:hypothetical protein
MRSPSRRTPLFGEEVKKLTEALAHIRGLWSAIKGSLKLTKKRGDYFTTVASTAFKVIILSILLYY